VTLLHHVPVELVADQVLWELRQQVERISPRRLVMDNLSELEQAIGQDRCRNGALAALLGIGKSRGVTSLMAREIAQAVGPELDFSDTPLAVLAENVILLRHMEFRGELHRIVSVLKMRDKPL
jgi:circadian clock protein KaiC